jgi:uncharacterized protein YecE (DUF72 family)
METEPRAGVTVGTAGWSLPKATADAFPAEGSHLARYAAVFGGVEINSSFYRPHRPATYAKWAGSVPATFRFAVKVPRSITHERALRDPDEPLDAFLHQVRALGESLGPLLVQLPPSGKFYVAVASAFLEALRMRHRGPVVMEPRHESWFTPGALELLASHHVSGVAADPARTPLAAEPTGDASTVYYRLHGSPVMYRSSYESSYLRQLADSLAAHRERGADVWCIFDNTTLGAATANALELRSMLTPPFARTPSARSA